METEQLETWRNAMQGRFQLVRMSALGQKTYEMIAGGRKFHLTPTERRLNQEMVASDDMDPFLDGTLQPVRLLEGTEETIVQNPNHITENDVRAMFGLHWKTFEKRLQDITNPTTLEQLLETSREDEINATVRQVELINDRLRVVSPPLFEPVETVSSGASGGPNVRAVSPR